jgi:uncharacterized membrane protein
VLAATLVAVAIVLGVGVVLRRDGTARAVVLTAAIAYGVAALVALYGDLTSRPRWAYGATAGGALAACCSWSSPPRR